MTLLELYNQIVDLMGNEDNHNLKVKRDDEDIVLGINVVEMGNRKFVLIYSDSRQFNCYNLVE
jgi:hypothetical protein